MAVNLKKTMAVSSEHLSEEVINENIKKITKSSQEILVRIFCTKYIDYK